MKIAIVVIAYNRSHSLKRLLTSLESVKHNAPKLEIPLVISIDRSNSSAVQEVAESFQWEIGPKKIIKHTEHLGLRKHILLSGDLVDEYENIIMLEDDLWVSPYFLDFSLQSIRFSRAHSQIAQISLYSNVYNEASFLPFLPFLDGYDNYYMKVPSSWGQIWTKTQWHAFKQWLPEYKKNMHDFHKFLPENVKRWPKTSWKKIFQSYVIAQDKVVLYPRISLTTNFMDAGTHHKESTYFLQTPPLTFRIEEYQFSSPEKSNAIYDEFCERDNLQFKNLVKQRFGLNEVVMDLYGSKNLGQYAGKFVITSQPAEGEVRCHFSNGLRPHELNLEKATQIKSNGIYKLVQVSSQNFINLKNITELPSLEQLLCYYVIPKAILPNEEKSLLVKEVQRFKRIINPILELFSQKCVEFLRRINRFITLR